MTYILVIMSIKLSEWVDINDEETNYLENDEITKTTGKAKRIFQTEWWIQNVTEKYLCA